MKHQSLMRAGIGALSLFMVLIILSLTLLSVLSYADAKQKETLANQYKTHALAYADADKEALTKKAIILQNLQGSKENFANFIEKEQFIYDEAQNMVSYSINIDASQQLKVSLIIKGQNLEIYTWEVVGR